MEPEAAVPVNGGRYEVAMVMKTLRVLEVLGAATDELRLAEIVRQSGVAKTSAYRILQTLAGAGYVETGAGGESYRLGHKIVKLGQFVRKNAELRKAGMPVLLKLRQAFNELVNLAVLDNGDVLYEMVMQSTASLRISVDHSRAPVHCTVLGKALLAHMPWSTVAGILKVKGMERRTARTICNPAAFRKELEAVRRNGIAFESEEFEEGGWCAACPVFDAAGEAVAAISVSAPLSRVLPRRQEIADAVRAAAAELSAALGFGGGAAEAATTTGAST